MLAVARAQPDGKDVAAALATLAAQVDDLELSGRAFGQTSAQVDAQHRTLEDYVFGELEYAQAKTCWVKNSFWHTDQ